MPIVPGPGNPDRALFEQLDRIEQSILALMQLAMSGGANATHLRAVQELREQIESARRSRPQSP
jgi:hypothetical protein